jgi:hypothetical protein
MRACTAMKRFAAGAFVITCAIVFGLAAAGEEYVYDQEDPDVGGMFIAGMNTGCAKTLTGNIYIYKIWLSENGWDPDRRRYQEESFTEGLEWLAANARAYGKRVRFTGGETTFKFRTLLDNKEQGHESVNIWPEVLQAASGLSPEMMNERVRRQGYTGWVLLIFADQPGRSYCHCIASGLGDWLEVAVIFSKYHAEDKNERAGVVAHELLHAFGAKDLYSSGNRNGYTERQEALAASMWPGELMLTSDAFGTVSISPYTAYCVGWHSDWDSAWDGVVPVTDKRRGRHTPSEEQRYAKVDWKGTLQ